MKIKRLVATVNAGFEQFVSKVENHEAVAEQLIEEVRQSAAKLKVQGARARHDRTRLQAQARRIEEEIQRWQQRAIAVADKDETQALACVVRLERNEKQLTLVTKHIAEHEKLIGQLADHSAAVEQQLAELQLRRTSLAGRDARTAVVRGRDEQRADEQAFAVFERWETQVVADEYREGVALDGFDETIELDELADGFVQAERQAQLVARLQRLREENSNDTL